MLFYYLSFIYFQGIKINLPLFCFPVVFVGMLGGVGAGGAPGRNLLVGSAYHNKYE